MKIHAMFNLLRLSLVLLLPLLLGTGGCGGLEIGAPPAPMIWYVGFDVTTSITAEEFAGYKQIAREAVLARLKNNDRVYVLRVDSDPQDSAESFSLNGGKLGLYQEIQKINAYIEGQIRQPERYRGTTNIGGFLAYVKRNITNDRKQRQKLVDQGTPLPPEPIYAAVLFSDGYPVGAQSLDPSEWPDDVALSVWGVQPQHIDVMNELCREMGIPGENVQLIRSADVQPTLTHFAREWNRPLNPQLLKALETNGAVHPTGL